jgi:hypothetical protein
MSSCFKSLGVLNAVKSFMTVDFKIQLSPKIDSLSQLALIRLLVIGFK